MSNKFVLLLFFLLGLVVFSFSVSASNEIIRPDGSGDLCNIPLESGDSCPDHYKNVDEETVSYADYVSNDVSTYYTDLYSLSNPVRCGLFVDNVTVFAVLKRSNGCGGDAKITIKSGGTLNNSSEFVGIPTVYTLFSYKMETNPVTGNDWNWSSIDDLQVGISLKGCTGGGPIIPGTAYCYQLYVVINATPLSSPSEVTASAPGDIVLEWSKGLYADSTVIVSNTSGYPSNVSDGSLIFNDTEESFTWSGMLGNTTYYFGLFSYNSSFGVWSGPAMVNITTLSDTTPPLLTVDHNASSGFDVDTGYVNVTVSDDFGGDVDVNITVNGVEFFNESVPDGNTSSTFSFNLSTNGSNIIRVVATDEAGNSNTKTVVFSVYYVNVSLVNERDGSVFDWSNAKNNGNLSGCKLTIPGRDLSIDLFTHENTSFTYVSPDADILRFNLSFDNTASSIIRSFSVDLLDAESNVGLVEVEQQFYAQLLYASTSKSVIMKNVFSDCFVLAGYLDDAYENYYSLQAVTIDMLYYLYTFDNGHKVLLSSIEGSRASNINVDFLTYQNTSYEFSMLSDNVGVSKVTNTTLKIFYKDLEADNEYVLVKLFDGDDLVFQNLETSDPNEFTLYFDYSTMSLGNDALLLSVSSKNEDGSTDVIEKHISLSGKVGMLAAEVAAIISVILILFGFTLASSRFVFNFFGIIILVVSLGITAVAVQEWYITFLQVLIVILLVITFFIYKQENPKIT